jgi:glutamate dehydrogenase/leucine dehydrogenase
MDEISYDNIGPAKIIRLYSAKEQLRAVVVIDNTALGPAIGGVRVSPTVDVTEVWRLARTMTLKNSIAGLSHGGAKAGIIADPANPAMERTFRVFARMIRDITDYIPGPDLGCAETAMAWIHDETGRAVGLPEEIGGLPLDTLGATGFGLAECAEVATPIAGIELAGARLAIQGFGSVGKAAARFLTAKGAILVAVADSQGAMYKPAGFDVEALIAATQWTGSVINAGQGTPIAPEAIFSIDCEILIPAAVRDVITERNAAGIKASLILEGANIPATVQAEQLLHARGVLIIPDFIANAGGVIMAAMEYGGKGAPEAFGAIRDRIRKNTGLIMEKATQERVTPRVAAEAIARERVLKAMAYRDY